MGALRVPGLPLRALAVAGGSLRAEEGSVPHSIAAHFSPLWLVAWCLPSFSPHSLPSWAFPSSFRAREHSPQLGSAALHPAQGWVPRDPAGPRVGRKVWQVTSPLWVFPRWLTISQVILFLGLSWYLVPAERCGTIWRALILESIEGFTS